MGTRDGFIKKCKQCARIGHAVRVQCKVAPLISRSIFAEAEEWYKSGCTRVNTHVPQDMAALMGSMRAPYRRG